MNDITLSAVMITYNHQRYIEEAIHGILMQKCSFNIELIIANDNSPDNTDQVIKELLKKNDTPKNIKIKYHYHSQNKGMMNNFIWALKQAKGKYIALCEGDDYWTDPFKLQKQVDFLENNENFSLCCTLQMLVTETGEPIKKEKSESRTYTIHDIVKGIIPGTQTMVFRNYQNLVALLEKLTPSPSGDRILAYCCSLFGNIYLLPEFMAAYRQTGKGVWSSITNEESYFLALEELIKFHISIGLPANNEIIFSRVNGAYPYLFKKDKKRFFKNIRRIHKIKETYHIKSSFPRYVFNNMLSKIF